MHFFTHRTEQFYPLTLTMPVQDILFGMNTLGEKWKAALPDLRNIWVDPAILPNSELNAQIRSLEKGDLLVGGKTIIACHPAEEQKPRLRGPLAPEDQDGFRIIDYQGKWTRIPSLQYLIDNNKSRILEEWNHGIAEELFHPHPAYNQTFIHPDAQVGHCFIDDSEGPVYIGRNVRILPGARIKGPVVILEGSLVKMSSELYPGSTFGRYTTLNGEIKNVIIHDFSAKGHEGYLGDSILGRWNNLGAGTTVSNLKHTFSKIEVENWNTGNMEKLDSLKRGVITGDFVRLGILTKINNGTTIGSFSSIATDALIRGRIPQLSWWAGTVQSNYDPEKAVIHARRQMEMKGESWNEQWENAFRQLEPCQSS